VRILVVNWQDGENPSAGGAEVHLHEIFSRLVSRRHEISLLVSGWPEGEAETELNGMRVLRVGGRYSFPLVARSAFKRHFAESDLDLLVEDVNKLPLYTPRWSGVPVVALVPHLFGGTAFQQESWPVAAAVWAAERLLPRMYRGIPFQAISRSTADDLVERGIERERIQVIFPGLDHGVFRPAPEPTRFEMPTLVSVGRLRRYKGLDIVFSALAILRARGLEVRLVVAGRGDDRARLERVAEAKGVTDLVEFSGFVSESRKVDLLRSAWVHVYPSPKEGWGISNVEAAACGTPSVASDSPGLRESVLDGETGYLVPHNGARIWAERLERLCREPALRDRMGRAALKHAARFTWETAADQTEAGLQAALSS